MDNCIFCKIVKGEMPCDKIYEDDEVLAFLDIAPVNAGHSLVIPKQHFVDIYTTPSHLMGKMMEVAKKVSSAAKKAVKADGINITMSNEEAGGQVVFHSHIHVIPRFKNDGFELWDSKKPYGEGEKKETAEKIASVL